MNKLLLRQIFKEKRDNLSEAELIEKSSKVIDNLTNTQEYKLAKNIMCFISFSSEIYTHQFIKDSIALGKNIYIPTVKLEIKEMQISKLVSWNNLEPGSYGILEDKSCELFSADPNILDIIITPGLAFDKRGYRLGYGGGYYDKFLAKLNKKVELIALAFSFQMTDFIPTDKFDIPVDKIITDKEIIICERP